MEKTKTLITSNKGENEELIEFIIKYIKDDFEKVPIKELIKIDDIGFGKRVRLNLQINESLEHFEKLHKDRMKTYSHINNPKSVKELLQVTEPTFFQKIKRTITNVFKIK